MSARDEATQTENEFRFLAGDAARVGRASPLPPVSRVEAPVAIDRHVSGLHFDAPTPPALMALHGAGLNAHAWDPMLLSLGRPALSIDLPGHGRSSWRDDADYRPDHLATDIEAALDVLLPAGEAAPVALVGHSLGGLTAALLAAAQPELVRALIVIDITPGVSPGGDAGAIAEFIRGQTTFASHEEMVDRAIEFGIGTDRTALMRGVVLNSRQREDGAWEWTHHLAHLDALPGDPSDPQPYAPIWGSLQALDIPITLVRASHGILSDEQVAEWREQLPGAPVVTLHGPHNLHEAVPAELAEVVREAMHE